MDNVFVGLDEATSFYANEYNTGGNLLVAA